jgi:hypothetical protein
LKHLAWDYELPGDPGDSENFYHVYTISDDAEDAFDEGGSVFTIKVPQSPEMSEIINDFVTRIDAYFDRHPAIVGEDDAPPIYIKLFD